MKLYIVSTPIGNLDDVSLRCLSTLKGVDLILCEDTRQTLKLLNHYDIHKPLLSYHAKSGIAKVNEILSMLKQGKDLALVSDSGTPGISDPGNKLIEIALKEIEGLEVIPIPGPSALISAASISGFPMDKFCFFGFAPKKKRKAFFEKIREEENSIILYESPYRIEETLKDLEETGEREIVLCRELTKKFETIYRGSIKEVREKLGKDNIKGEFVIVLKRKKD